VERYFAQWIDEFQAQARSGSGVTVIRVPYPFPGFVWIPLAILCFELGDTAAVKSSELID
jgi:hypothetical protein